MNSPRHEVDVAVAGGGPGGLAAACTASECGASVVLLESTPWLGGQIWRYDNPSHAPRQGRRWIRRVHNSNVNIRLQSMVYGVKKPHTLLVEGPQGVNEIKCRKLILAVGARELFVPFPGWTLPNVFGVGGLHNLAKLGWPVAGKRVVVAGSGPLMFALAAHMRKLGAKVVLMAEQADFRNLSRFGLRLPALAPDKLVQAAGYQAKLLGVPYLTHCWPVEALGREHVQAVRLTNGKKTWLESCDYLACAFGLMGNLELAQLLGCQIEDERVGVDDYQQTSVPDVYCVGEPTGIAGVDGALIEGRIAGSHAADQSTWAESLFAARNRSRHFGAALARFFVLRPELRDLVRPDTLICRCEDITFAQARHDAGWRAAKLYRHLGMGPCQGRTCSGVVRFLFGWESSSARPPIFPVQMDTLAGYNQTTSDAVRSSTP